MTDKIIAVLIIIILLYLVFNVDWVYALFAGVLGYLIIHNEQISGGTLLGPLKNVSGEMALVGNVDPFPNNNYAFIITGRKLMGEQTTKEEAEAEMKDKNVKIVEFNETKKYKYVVINSSESNEIEKYIQCVERGGKLAIIGSNIDVKSIPYLYEISVDCVTIECDAAIQKSKDIKILIQRMLNTYKGITSGTTVDQVMELIQMGNISMLNYEDVRKGKDFILRCSNVEGLNKSLEVNALLPKESALTIDPNQEQTVDPKKKKEYKEYVGLFNDLKKSILASLYASKKKVNEELVAYLADPNKNVTKLDAAIANQIARQKLFETQLNRVKRIADYLATVTEDRSSSKPADYYRYLVFNVLDNIDIDTAEKVIESVKDITKLGEIEEKIKNKYPMDSDIAYQYVIDMLFDDGKIKFTSSKGKAASSKKNFILDGCDTKVFGVKEYKPELATIEKIQ